MIIKLPKWMTVVIKAAETADRCLRRDKVSVYAAQAAYFILFSSIPLIMLFLNILRYFVPKDTVALISVFVDFLPGTISELGKNVINELLYAGNIPLISITSLLLLWSGSRGVKCIAIAIRSIYNNNEDKGYIYNSVISLLYAFILIIIMAISLVILIFGAYLEDLLTEKYNIPNILVKGLFSVRNLIALIIITLVVMLVYRRFSGKVMKFKNHFIGAIICSFSCLLYTHFYTIYIDNFSNYSYIYGGLAAVLLLMLWLYMCMYILIVGAIINVNIAKNIAIVY